MEKCYANALGDCSGKISKEHYISKKILEFAQEDMGRISLEGELRACSAKNLKNKKMLCTKHNSQLSRIDAEMLKLVKTVFNWNSNPRSVSETFNGSLITRWLFKYGAGIIIADGLRSDANSYMFEKDWLEILFGVRPLPSWCGFEASGPAQIFNSGNEFNNDVPPWVTSLLALPNNKIIGAQIGLYPIEVFTTFQSSISQELGSFRLSEIILETKDNESSLSLNFEWPIPRKINVSFGD